MIKLHLAMSDHHQQSVPKERRLSQSGKRSAPGASFKSSTHHLQPTQKLSPPVKTPNGSFHVPALPKQPRTQSQTQELCVAKIAIPRLARDSDSVSAAGSSVIGDKHRVNHACQPCRHRKTKCSGERPMCKHCQDFKIDCIYMDGKRDRVKKYFNEAKIRFPIKLIFMIENSGPWQEDSEITSACYEN